MNILLPTTITPSMFGAGTTIPAVDASAGEVLWVSGATYAVKDRRVWEGYTYECIKAAPSNTTPPSSTAGAEFWLRDEGAPTNRMAPFDEYLFTRARRSTSLTYVLNPGFVTGLAIYGIEADTLDVRVRAGPGGPDLVPPVHLDLWEQAYGEWEYLFGNLERGTSYTLKDIPLHPAAEVTITLSRNNAGVEAAVGYISVGQWSRLLAPSGRVSAVVQGAEASTKSYGYFKENADGTFIRRRGRQSTNMTLSCVIDADQANAANTLLKRVLDQTVAIEASGLPRFGYLSTVGSVTGSVKADTSVTASVALQIKGNV
ncbi:hypothetical protein [Paracidovorax cattleyae]|uniref:hypothetical protein n=1 Tax=Paracidovorax cattleyae TaxID=80868 RepID=UPI0018AFC0BB|nr:hypothetical protein [Paracidovorax cattleyae]MBF9263940.1 hypothetical protein [Paracidovorax cattleyae]